MKFRTLWNGVMLQGEIRIKVYNHDTDKYTIDRKAEELFKDPKLVTWKSLLDREVTYIYPQLNSETFDNELVIELEAEES